MLKSARFRIVAIALFLTLPYPCLSQSAPSKPQALSTQTTIEPVTLAVSVVNKKGDFALGLHRDNFQISIDKQPADIVDFREEDVPLSVGIVFDASGSAGFPQLDRWVKFSQRAVGHFLETSNKANEYFLMAFNIQPQLLLDWTNDSRAIIKTLGTVEPKGNTAFYDACYLALDKIRQGRYSKRVLILITDGQDNLSRYSYKQVRDELRASGVVVYSVNLSNLDIAGSSFGMEGQQILKELSLTSGGRVFYNGHKRYLEEKDVVSAFEIIAQELRHQYTIVVAPKVAAHDNKWHKIKIQVEVPGTKNLSAQTREGFYLNQR